MPCGDADYPIDRVILILSGLSRTHSERLKTITQNEKGKRCLRFRRVRTRSSVPGKNRLHPLPPVCVTCNTLFPRKHGCLLSKPMCATIVAYCH